MEVKNGNVITSDGRSVRVEPEDFSDAGNAEIFADVFKGELEYSDARGWMRWNGREWTSDGTHATKCGVELSKAMLEDAREKFFAALDKQMKLNQNTEDGERAAAATKKAKAYLDHAMKLRNGNHIRTMTELAKPDLSVDPAVYDANPFELNTPVGIVDLKTGRIRPHNPDSHCTKTTTIAPGSDGAKPWSSFLNGVTGGNVDLQKYLQLVFGMAAFGKVFEEGIVLAYGTGGNGKSTFVNACAAVLGTYAGSMKVQVLTSDRLNTGAAMATMRGRRLVVTGEMEETERLKTSLLKQIASTDSMVVEEKYKAPETVIPSHTIVLYSNHLPRVTSNDAGTWRRLNVVPFRCRVAHDSAIMDYSSYLVERAGAAILQWIVDGAAAFWANGCKIDQPDCIAAETKKYRDREDWLADYIGERCYTGDGCKVRSSDLYSSYREWAEENGVRQVSNREFSPLIEQRGYRKSNTHGVKWYTGIGISPPNDGELIP